MDSTPGLKRTRGMRGLEANDAAAAAAAATAEWGRARGLALPNDCQSVVDRLQPRQQLVRRIRRQNRSKVGICKFETHFLKRQYGESDEFSNFFSNLIGYFVKFRRLQV